MTIEEFIAAEAAKPFAWARNDCTMMCDRWVQLMRSVSPVDVGQIRYGDRDSAMVILHRLPHLMNRAMRIAGLNKTPAPHAGDVGLVVFGNRIGPALHSGRHWITRHEDGFMAAPLNNVWKAWAI